MANSNSLPLENFRLREGELRRSDIPLIRANNRKSLEQKGGLSRGQGLISARACASAGVRTLMREGFCGDQSRGGRYRPFIKARCSWVNSYSPPRMQHISGILMLRQLSALKSRWIALPRTRQPISIEYGQKIPQLEGPSDTFRAHRPRDS